MLPAQAVCNLLCFTLGAPAYDAHLDKLLMMHTPMLTPQL